MTSPFIAYVKRRQGVAADSSQFPGNLPFVEELHHEFRHPVTFLLGENGSGKSTLLEAIAVLSGFPQAGGGTNDLTDFRGPEQDSELSHLLQLAFLRRPKDGWFFRAELQAQFASLLDQRRRDPDFRGDPYSRYGGQSLHTMSHGEAFLTVMKNRFSEGLFLLDEPESALSPQRQLALLALMYDLVQTGNAQFIIATHSPILLTYPQAEILSFDNEQLTPVLLEDTAHYRITHGILSRPESYWKHLRGVTDTAKNDTADNSDIRPFEHSAVPESHEPCD